MRVTAPLLTLALVVESKFISAAGKTDPVLPTSSVPPSYNLSVTVPSVDSLPVAS